MEFETILRAAESAEASDVIVKSEGIPSFKVHGVWQRPTESQSIPALVVSDWAAAMMPPPLAEQYRREGSVDFAISSSSGRRFRVSLFRQMGMVGMVLRTLPRSPGRLDKLGIPSSFAKTILQSTRGLALVTGVTGSGKSSTISAVLQVINQSRACHVITIEDPIEFVFKDEMATFQQREIGQDAASFPVALRAALRQAPDIIFVGELRDRETVETAMHAANTGHLVVSTLHTKDAGDSLGRILSYFEPREQELVRKNLAESMLLTLSQRLVQRADAPGLTAACEVMVCTSYVRKLILESSPTSEVVDAIKNGSKYGMVTFDQSLFSLFQQGIISRDEALLQASSRQDLELMLDGIQHS
ncbi:MAG: PilT/PilU family type 4a pilus ATPase [Zetaproteobacteria bacterium]|nr:PilT/PilU family type 4a pilus ATPase [Zetaproteobacteria bacterium]